MPATAELQRWFSVAGHTCAVIDAQALPQIAEVLPRAGLKEWGRLERGAIALDAAQAWCVELEPDHEFSHWLLAGDGAKVADWGVLVYSDAPFRSVREHLRGLLEAQMPTRERVPLRWHKPAVMRTLLPLCNASQLDQIFGPIACFVLPGRTGSSWLRSIGGVLDIQAGPAA